MRTLLLILTLVLLSVSSAMAAHANSARAHEANAQGLKGNTRTQYLARHNKKHHKPRKWHAHKKRAQAAGSPPSFARPGNEPGLPPPPKLPALPR